FAEKPGHSRIVEPPARLPNGCEFGQNRTLLVSNKKAPTRQGGRFGPQGVAAIIPIKVTGEYHRRVRRGIRRWIEDLGDSTGLFQSFHEAASKFCRKLPRTSVADDNGLIVPGP